MTNCVPHFADPTVAFLQTPQHYREWRDSPYLRGLFYAYRYFFDVTMVARARVNAIIFGGTMGLIRLRVLRDIGGWAEWCITEDAEASLRILAEGWKSVYLGESYGQGLMPLDFDGLRRQRFRWAFGGVQILRRHFGLLIGLKRSKLTMWQRYHYLVGGLGWFGDLVGVGLSAFLLLTAPLLVIGQPRLTLAPLLAVLAAGLLAPAIATSTADERTVESALGISPARPIPVLAAAPPSTPSPSPSSEALRGPSASQVSTSVPSAVPSRAPTSASTSAPTAPPTPASGATASPSSRPTAQPTSPPRPSSRPSISPTSPSQRPTPR